MVSEATEIQLGERYYGPSRQSQGGDYVTDPAVTTYVRQVGNKLAAVADRKLPYEFVVLNSGELNAWALPGGKIAVNRGLLVELSSEAELAAVLGHEIVHAAARHGAQQMEKGQLMQIGAAVASLAAAAYGGAQLGQAVGQGAALGGQMLQAKYGRGDELEADKYGMKYMKLAGYDLAAAVTLQEMFVRKFEAGTDQSWMTGLFASHPPSAERVAANRRTLTELGGAGGEVGAERYKTALAGLKRAAPAYAKHEQALAAGNKNDFAAARSLAGEAIKLEPRESRFYGLLGDIELASENPRAALGLRRASGRARPRLLQTVVAVGRRAVPARQSVGRRAVAAKEHGSAAHRAGCLLPRARQRGARQHRRGGEDVSDAGRLQVGDRSRGHEPAAASRRRRSPGALPHHRAASG